MEICITYKYYLYVLLICMFFINAIHMDVYMKLLLQSIVSSKESTHLLISIDKLVVWRYDIVQKKKKNRLQFT